MKRTFWPVGQGAFYSELFYKDGKQDGLIVYDCGTRSGQEYVLKSIQDLEQLTGDIDIDILFISHFHSDHISGIKQLTSDYKVKAIVLPYVSTAFRADVYIENYIHDKSENKEVLSYLEQLLSSDSKIDIHRVTIQQSNGINESLYKSGANRNTLTMSELLLKREIKEYTTIQIHDWKYIPFNYRSSKYPRIIKAINEQIPGLFDCIKKEDWIGARTILGKYDIDTIESKYESVFGNKHNEESMTVLSCPIIDYKYEDDSYCLYTGDSPFSNSRRLKAVLGYYDEEWNKIAVLQSPHHGADSDNPAVLYDVDRKNVVCFGKHNSYGHPGFNAIKRMASKGKCYKITEEDAPKHFCITQKA